MGKCAELMSPGCVMMHASGIDDDHWRERMCGAPFLVVSVNAGVSIRLYAKQQHMHTAVWALAADNRGRLVRVVVRPCSFRERQEALRANKERRVSTW